jgi:hypothetical protein
MAFYKAEGVIAVLESQSGWPGAVRGFARPGAGADGYSREATLASPSIIAIIRVMPPLLRATSS